MNKEVETMLKQIRPDIDFRKENKLLSDGILDSFDFIQIISKLVDVFEIEVDPMDVTADDFDSAEKIAAFIKSKKR
ncbi:acyl carrier protein [Butyrivibrio fibrisolvens]|uniref:acyl carrier protein n=1 Tax=Butyrivibrio fibrisolvens TaxID=831 RepID=UPI0020BF424C|nr:acyl carrier protein [Butyrivibrio fibrisolvens]